jgi:hypothetical protein
MKKLIHNGVKVAAFIGFFLIVNATLRHGYLGFIDVRLHDKGVLLDPNVDLTGYDTLVLGDSRALFGVLPEGVADTLNVAALGEGHMISYYKLVQALERRQWRTVLVPVGRHSFSRTRSGQVEHRFRTQYIRFGDLIRNRGGLTRYVPAYLQHRMFPHADLPLHLDEYLNFRRDLQARRRTKEANLLSDFSQVEGKLGRAKAKVRTHLGPDRDWWNDEMVFFFERILELSRERDVQVVLIRYPVTTVYAEAMEELVPGDEFNARLNRLLEDWPEVKYLDYLMLYADRDELFADVDHLNAAGILLFNERLVSDLGK